MVNEDIRNELFSRQDIKYRDFQSKLIPNVDKDAVIGVRIPELRKMAKSLSTQENIGEFLENLPHRYYDENQLHGLIISEIKDYKICIDEIERFLPYVDSWATCDSISPKVLKKHKDELLKKIKEWIVSKNTFTVRFAIGMLMKHFLDDDFKTEYPDLVATVRSDEYYINMMIAWYFATAFAKQYESIVPYIENKRLSPWTHNKAIQKAVESYRITSEQKEYLKSYKIKN